MPIGRITETETTRFIAERNPDILICHGPTLYYGILPILPHTILFRMNTRFSVFHIGFQLPTPPSFAHVLVIGRHSVCQGGKPTDKLRQQDELCQTSHNHPFALFTHLICHSIYHPQQKSCDQPSCMRSVIHIIIPYPIQQIIQNKSSDGNEQNLSPGRLAFIKQQTGKQSTIQAENCSGSPYTNPVCMAKQTGHRRIKPCKRIDHDDPERAQHRFQKQAYEQKGIYIHYQMYKAGMYKIASPYTPIITC